MSTFGSSEEDWCGDLTAVFVSTLSNGTEIISSPKPKKRKPASTKPEAKNISGCHLIIELSFLLLLKLQWWEALAILETQIRLSDKGRDGESVRVLIAVAELQWKQWCWEKTLKYAYLRERRQHSRLLDSDHLTRFTVVFIVSPLVLVPNAGKISIFYTTQFYKKYSKWKIKKGFHLCILFSISLFYLISQYHVVIFHTWFQIRKISITYFVLDYSITGKQTQRSQTLSPLIC